MSSAAAEELSSDIRVNLGSGFADYKFMTESLLYKLGRVDFESLTKDIFGVASWELPDSTLLLEVDPCQRVKSEAKLATAAAAAAMI